MSKESYTTEDKKCPHCGGNITSHLAGVHIIYWCDSCGSNNRKTPPNISIKIIKQLKQGSIKF